MNPWNYQSKFLTNSLINHRMLAGEVSYRLTSNRFDWKNWSNIYSKEDHPTEPLTEKK